MLITDIVYCTGVLHNVVVAYRSKIKKMCHCPVYLFMDLTEHCFLYFDLFVILKNYRSSSQFPKVQNVAFRFLLFSNQHSKIQGYLIYDDIKGRKNIFFAL